MVGYASDRSFDSLSRIGPTLTHPASYELNQATRDLVGRVSVATVLMERGALIHT